MSDNADDALPEFKEGFRILAAPLVLECSDVDTAPLRLQRRSTPFRLRSSVCSNQRFAEVHSGPGAVSFVGNLILRQQPLV